MFALKIFNSFEIIHLKKKMRWIGKFFEFSRDLDSKLVNQYCLWQSYFGNFFKTFYKYYFFRNDLFDLNLKKTNF